MNNKFVYLVKHLMINASYPMQMGVLALMACLFALMIACTTGRPDSSGGPKIRLAVGEIKELTMATRSDTTWQLTATSDNQEVVDVSRKTPVATGTRSPATRPAIFLLKGVTAGAANVVFSEKQMGADGNGQVKKTYVVMVTGK